MKKFRVVNSIVPISISLFSNSSIVEKKKSNYLSYRSKVWQNTSRGGLPKLFLENLNFEKYHDQIFAVNFFASWCAPCRIEAPVIDELSKILPVIGIAYKDKYSDTKQFLDNFGNPYIETGIDKSGKIAIEWGVYGVPETFLINKKGEIIYRHAGPLLYGIFKDEVLPLLESSKND